jgi:hypothetical protein
MYSIPRVVHERMGIGQKEGYSYHHLMILSRVFKIWKDKFLPDSSEWMVLLSFATNEMIRYMSMYPLVWFIDCTAGMYEYKSYLTIHTNMIHTLSYPCDV